jgi:putative phosphoribosyl transferase
MSWFPPRFANRTVAGIQLAHVLVRRDTRKPDLILGLPRGGLPVAYQIARALGVPLDVMPVRKIGMPRNREVAIGAIAGKTVVRDPSLAAQFPSRVFENLAHRERVELHRRECVYRTGLGPLNLDGLEVLLVDDGLATGCTALAAVREARRLGAASIVVAAPVASDNAEALVRAQADKTIILNISAELSSVGAWYEDFRPVEDAEVCELLDRARPASPSEATWSQQSRYTA